MRPSDESRNLCKTGTNIMWQSTSFNSAIWGGDLIAASEKINRGF